MNLRYWQQFRVTASQRNSLKHKLQALYKNIIPPRKLGTRDLKIDQQNSVQNEKRYREQFENWRLLVKQDWTSLLRLCPEMSFRAFQWPCCFHSCIYHRSFYVSAQIHKFPIVCTQGQYLVSLKRKKRQNEELSIGKIENYSKIQFPHFAETNTEPLQWHAQSKVSSNLGFLFFFISYPVLF